MDCILRLGFRRLALPYERQPREIGQSAWTFRGKLKYLSDSVFAFSDLPHAATARQATTTAARRQPYRPDPCFTRLPRP